MRYIDESLAPGEVIIQRGKWPTLFWVGAWLALILLGIVLVGIYIFIHAAVVMKTTDFAVTNKRVVVKRGWLNRRTEELAVESVEGVALHQSLWARIWGYGRVVVTGTGDATINFPAMAHPVSFRRAIEKARADRDEVHLSPSDRVALEEAAHPQEAPANDDAANDAEAEEAPRQRRRAKRSFIGLRSR